MLRRPSALLAVCVLLAVVHTWPMAAAPHRHSRLDNGDYRLNAWAIAWIAHQLPRDPAHLFDGNIFWPERRTLAYSEAMIVQGVLAAPILWLGGSPVLAFNLVMLAGFVFTGFVFGLVTRHWTGSWTAAYVAASAAGFNAHLLMRLGHLQAMHPEFVALVLLGLDRVFDRQRVRDAVVLGCGYALQGLTSVYLLTFTTWVALFATLARFVSTARTRWARATVLLALAGVLAVAILSPYLITYVRLNRDRGFARAPEENQAFAGSYTDYLSSGSRLHYPWSKRFVDRSASINFPGFTVLLLAGAALGLRATRGDRRVRMLAVAAAGCAAVSMAARMPGYEHIHRWVPLFWAVRVQAHMGQLVLLLCAVLAGYGAWRARAWWGTRRHAWVVGTVLVVLINAEALRAPFVWREYTGIPAAYDILAALPRAVVVELPAYEGGAVFGNAPYMFNSTRHWHPLVNGYSGFVPQSYAVTAEALRTFPDLPALEMLRRRAVTHVVIHETAFAGRHGHDALVRVSEIGSLQEIARDGDIRIYRFR